jgi:CheY-like chemotaxis protein
MRVLIIEDDEPTLLTLMDIFEEYLPEFELSVLSDSTNYQQRISELGVFDLFIFDIYLGTSMPGNHVAKWMREQAVYKNTPMIAFTADSVIEGEELLKDGFDAVIIKPIRDVHLFVGQLLRVMSGERFIYNN